MMNRKCSIDIVESLKISIFSFDQISLFFKLSELYREKCDNNKEGKGEGVPMRWSVIGPTDSSSLEKMISINLLSLYSVH